MYQSGASLVGHVFLWVCGSCFWRKWNGRIKGRDSLRHFLSVCFWNWWEEQIWTPPWVCYPGSFVRKWSLCTDLTFEVTLLLQLLYMFMSGHLSPFLFPVLTFCPILCPFSLPPTVLSFCCVFVTHALNSHPICHFPPCTVLLFLVFCLSVRLNWHDALCFQNIFSLLKSSVSRIIFQPCFYHCFIIFFYLFFFSETSPTLPSTTISVL